MAEATPRLCATCQKDISDRNPRAERCVPCARIRNRTKVTSRPPRAKCDLCNQRHWPGLPHQNMVCEECGSKVPRVRPYRHCSTVCKKRAASRRHRERNPGYYKRYTGSPSRKAYVQANRLELARQARAYRVRLRDEDPQKWARSLELSKQWWAKNADRHRLYRHERRARQLSNPGYAEVSQKDWRRLVLRYQNLCAYCGVKAEKLHMDHVIALSRGGRHAIGNLLPACQRCNSSKTDKYLTEWRVWLASL